MPDKIRKLALNILSNPERVDISISKPASGIVQSVYLCNDNQKLPLVYDILSKQNFTSVLIFGSTKLSVKNIGKELVRKGLNAQIISSDLEQSERESVLASFRSKRTTILVATDVLSRGIDIDSIELVINFDVPPDPEDYVHRVGRTARAQTKGEAVTIVNEKDFYKLVGIERMIESEIPKKQLPEYLGPTPQFTLDGSNKMKNRRKKFKSNSKQ